MQMGMFKNEMKCLSNAVLQFCVKKELQATWGIVQFVRKIVTDNAIPLSEICHIRLFQEPQGTSFVQHALILTLDDGTTHDIKFQSATMQPYDFSYTLYDRERDGEVEYLHLVH